MGEFLLGGVLFLVHYNVKCLFNSTHDKALFCWWPCRFSRQDKTRQYKHVSSCTCISHDAVPQGHMMTDRGEREKNESDIPLLIPALQICTYGYAHILPCTVLFPEPASGGSKHSTVKSKNESVSI